MQLASGGKRPSADSQGNKTTTPWRHHRVVICYPLFKRKKSLYSTQHINALRKLAQNLSIWSSKDSLESIVTPSSFCEFTCSGSEAFSLNCNCGCSSFLSSHLPVVSITLVFFSLRIILLLSDHFCKLFKSDWRLSLHTCV